MNSCYQMPVGAGSKLGLDHTTDPIIHTIINYVLNLEEQRNNRDVIIDWAGIHR